VKFRSRVDKLQLASRSHGIDWSSTRAYTDRHVEVFSTIWINVKGREPEGIVEPGSEYEDLRDYIICQLKNLKDPHTHERMVHTVYKREEIFKGINICKTPDIIVEWKDNAYRTQDSLRSGYSKFLGTITTEETSQTISGEHRSNGIFIIRGEKIKEGVEIKGVSIIDLAPTILHLAGLSIPRGMDGKVLGNAFKKDCMKNITKSEESIFLDRCDETPFTKDEQQKVAERLRALGYLD